MWFKKKDPAAKLQAQYEKLMEASFKLSRTNRAEADGKYAEAQVILEKIEALENGKT